MAAGEAWDEGGDSWLRELVESGRTDAEIAQRMGRTETAITVRRRKLKLRRAGVPRRARLQPGVRTRAGHAASVRVTEAERDFLREAAETTGASLSEWGAAVVSNRLEEVARRLKHGRRRRTNPIPRGVKTVQFQLHFPEGERAMLTKVAKAVGYSQRDWVREELLREAHDVLHGYDPVNLQPSTPPHRSVQVCAAMTVDEDDLVHEAAALQGVPTASWAYAVLAGEIEATGSRVENPKGGFHAPWTPQMKADLHRLFKEGLGDAAIAQQMGLEKDAVMRGRYREGLVRRVKWTPQAEQHLTRLFRAGASDVEIAKAIGATRASVKMKRRQLGLARETGLSPEVKKLVKEFFDLGFTTEQTAEQLGIKAHQVRDLRKVMGLRKLGRWTDAQKDRVRELYAAGASDHDIGKALGVGSRSAESMRRRLGLPRERFIWTPELKAELTQLYEQGWTDDQLARHFGSTPKGVLTIRSTMGIVKEIVWTPRRDAQLRSLFAQGLSDPELTKQLGVPSVGGLRSRRHKLGLRRREALFWTRDRDQRLQWLFNQGFSDEDIAKDMGVTVAAVRVRRGLFRLGRGPLLVEEPRSESVCASVTPHTRATAKKLASRLAKPTSEWFREALLDAATRTVVPDELPFRRNPAALKRRLLTR